jgi:hypothetical protein
MQQVLEISIVTNTQIEQMRKPVRFIYFFKVAQLGKSKARVLIQDSQI